VKENQEVKKSTWGGRRPGAGRKRGARLKRVVDREQLIAERAAAMAVILGSDAFVGDSVELLQLLYKDPRLPAQLRFEAAKAAAPYERPRLSSVDHQGEAAKSYVARMPAKAADMSTWAAELKDVTPAKAALDKPKGTVYQN